MTSEGILARGEANYKANKFLTNSETLVYMATLPKESNKSDTTVENSDKKPTEKEGKDVKSKSG